jgi:hypothetical protein
MNQMPARPQCPSARSAGTPWRNFSTQPGARSVGNDPGAPARPADPAWFMFPPPAVCRSSSPRAVTREPSAHCHVAPGICEHSAPGPAVSPSSRASVPVGAPIWPRDWHVALGSSARGCHLDVQIAQDTDAAQGVCVPAHWEHQQERMMRTVRALPCAWNTSTSDAVPGPTSPRWACITLESLVDAK